MGGRNKGRGEKDTYLHLVLWKRERHSKARRDRIRIRSCRTLRTRIYTGWSESKGGGHHKNVSETKQRQLQDRTYDEYTLLQHSSHRIIQPLFV